MTIVVLLILVLVWAVVLGPSLLRGRSERVSRDSIGAFHRHLRVLERTGPTLVNPAYRLGAVATDDTSRARRSRAEAEYGPGLMVVRPDRVPHVAVSDSSRRSRPDPFFRAQACRRRRHVLSSLMCVVVVTGLLGSIPALRLLLGVTAFTVLVGALYVVLLVRLRTSALEREVKLRYLPPPVEHEPQIVIRRSATR